MDVWALMSGSCNSEVDLPILAVLPSVSVDFPQESDRRRLLSDLVDFSFLSFMMVSINYIARIQVEELNTNFQVNNLHLMLSFHLPRSKCFLCQDQIMLVHSRNRTEQVQFNVVSPCFVAGQHSDGTGPASASSLVSFICAMGMAVRNVHARYIGDFSETVSLSGPQRSL